MFVFTLKKILESSPDLLLVMYKQGIMLVGNAGYTH